VKQIAPDHGRLLARRRGVTLVEMLVTLAVLLLLMTFIVKIFQAATGSLSAAQVYQELDNQLRLLDSTIRSDLGGVTASLTPPNDPKNNKGYLEYGENEFADVQGEDADDYIRFTAKAPAGRPFVGRMWVPPPPNVPFDQMSAAQQANYLASQPVTISSEFAEIIYFLRNGNLYRRVLLVAPERQAAVANSISVAGAPNVWVYKDPATQNIFKYNFQPVALGSTPISWQGVNDVSAHPAPRGVPTTNSVMLNTLGDLTNRENRAFYQRFGDDFVNLAGAAAPDGLSDDLNGDNVPDYYPTLYPLAASPAVINPQNGNQLVFYPPWTNPNGVPWPPQFMGAMAFPFVYPGAYSRPQVLTNGTDIKAGWIHSPEPQVVDKNGNQFQFDGPNTAPLTYLQNLNHNPLDIADNLPDPSSGLGGLQTWWGFPTWRETLSPFWTDPTWQVNTNQIQPFGLAYQVNDPFGPNTPPVANTFDMLPDMTATAGYRPLNPQLYNDGLPNNVGPPGPNGFFPAGTPQFTLWGVAWEDDLIMTGVRSFDIKAYDNAYASYVDLGWGDDLRVTATAAPQYLLQTPATTTWGGVLYNTLTQTFAHEGRMPPLSTDLRFDAQFGAVTAGTYTNAGFPNYTGNVGDDNTEVFRLRRVWDSWSTEYSQAPGTGINPTASALPFFPAGPTNAPPIYPSYPPPYPAPLRGIQIQIRVTDPTNQRIKSLTIRVDFTDKL
jgi:prepilin-type N-terminal cleavage/methylation domain-containing protein